MNEARPLRSALYIPGSKPRALEKARGLPCDAIIFDLEDAVAPGEKDAAREALAAALGMGGYGRRFRLVRVNALGTPWAEADLAAFGPVTDAVLLPKVEDGASIAAARSRLPGSVAVWAMMETPRGILAAAEIASAGCAGFVLGTNDLAKDLRCDLGAGRAPLMTALQLCLLAARAHGIPCIDGVFNAFRDEPGFRAECEEGRAFGMDGKSLIHPNQIAPANEIFAPSAPELDLARRQIEAHEAAEAAGQGVAVLDGRIVESLHVQAARATLARADAIAALEMA